MKIIGAAVFCLGYFLIRVSAQDQNIDQRAFDAGLQRYQQPPAEWRSRGRRVVTEITQQVSGLPYSSATTTAEYDAAGSVWATTEATNASAGIPTNIESIRIGNVIYYRVGNEAWKQKEAPPPSSASGDRSLFESSTGKAVGISDSGPPGIWNEFRVGSIEYKGKTLLVYSKTLKSKTRRASDGIEIDSETINRYWLGPDGRMVKFEQLITHRGKGYEFKQTYMSEWEADSSIAIKAPTKVF